LGLIFMRLFPLQISIGAPKAVKGMTVPNYTIFRSVVSHQQSQKFRVPKKQQSRFLSPTRALKKARASLKGFRNDSLHGIQQCEKWFKYT